MSAADTLRKCVALLKQVDFADCAESEALWHQHGAVLQEAEAVLRDGEKQEPVAWRTTFNDFRHFSGATASGRDYVQFEKPVHDSRFFEGCDSLVITPLYDHPAPSLPAVGAVPEGYALVPLVATDDMIVAFAEQWYSKRQVIDDPDMADAYKAMLAVAPQPAAAPSGDAIRELIALHADELEQNDYAYFELARTRRTGWMAWICTNLIDNDQARKVLANGQGSTPDEACEAAIQDYKGRASVQCDSRG